MPHGGHRKALGDLNVPGQTMQGAGYIPACTGFLGVSRGMCGYGTR